MFKIKTEIENIINFKYILLLKYLCNKNESERKRERIRLIL